MRAGDQQCPRRRDVRFLDVGLGDGHVGAVLAQEDERKCVAVLDAEHDRARQPGGVGADVRDVAAFAGDRLEQKPAERVVADARDQPRLQAQAGAAEGGIGR